MSADIPDVHVRLERGPLEMRTPREVLVADAVKEFSPMVVDKAVYGTGWDGTVIVEVALDGRLRVRSRGPRQRGTRSPGPPQ